MIKTDMDIILSNLHQIHTHRKEIKYMNGKLFEPGKVVSDV